MIFLIFFTAFPHLISRLNYELEGPFTWDTPMYWTVGRAFLDGKKIYVEMFENKPPIIFLLSALSYRLTSDYYLLNVFSFFIHLSIIPIIILIAYKVKRSLWMILLGLILGIFSSLYSFMNSAYVQVEAFGFYFALIYLVIFYWNQNKYSLLISAIEGFFLMIATLTKEPFYLVLFGISFILFKNWSQWRYHFFYASIFGGIFGGLLLIITQSFTGYFFVYLPHMLTSHVGYYGSPFSRGFNIFFLIRDLQFHLSNFFGLFMILSVVVIINLLVFKKELFIILKNWQSFLVPFQYAFAIYLASFAVGLGGQYYNHHYIFASPLYVVLGVNLSKKLLEIDDSLFQLMFQRFLTTTYTLGIMVTLLFLPSFNEPLPLLTWQSQMRLHAKFVDRLTDYYQVDTYQFIGFNGPQFYGHTEQLPKGPVFFQDPRNFQSLDSWFVQTFFSQIEEVNLILVHHVDLGVAQAQFDKIIMEEFVLVNQTTILIDILEKPQTFSDRIYLRLNLK
jgi:hypothetical protein